MPFGLVFFCQCITFTLGGDAMQKFWPGDIAQVAQYFYKVFNIMPVNGAEISEFKRFEKVTSFKQGAFDAFLQLLGYFKRIRAYS